MTVDRLLTNVAQLVTPSGSGAVRGRAMRELRIIEDAAVAITAGRITWCGPRAEWTGHAAQEIDAGGCLEKADDHLVPLVAPFQQAVNAHQRAVRHRQHCA